VMLAVATSDAVTGPTRLLFPRVPRVGGQVPDFPFSLLGLGDVALPGLLAALALRYDASRRWGEGGAWRTRACPRGWGKGGGPDEAEGRWPGRGRVRRSH
jgi:hypothetical protein